MQATPQQAKARFRLLPPKLQDAIFDSTTADLIRRIGEQNHLNEEKMGLLSGAAGSVLLGFTHIEDAALEIEKRVGLPRELSSAIAGELVVKLFGPLRQDIERSYAPEGEAPAPKESLLKPGPDSSSAESYMTGLYPTPKEPLEPIASMPKKVSLQGDKSPVSEAATQKISPLAYGDKFDSKVLAVGQKEPAPQTPAPKILHEQKGPTSLPVSNIPRLGLGLGDDKLGSISGGDDEDGLAAKIETSGLSSEQLAKIESRPLPSFMKREIPAPRVVNYQKPKMQIGEVSIKNPPAPSRVEGSPNFPIVTTPKPGTVGGMVNRPAGKISAPLPGTPGPAPLPTSFSKTAPEVQQKIKSNEGALLKPAPKKSWLAGLWGSKSQDEGREDIVLKKVEPTDGQRPTPIQSFQAKKVDYHEEKKSSGSDKIEVRPVAPSNTPPALTDKDIKEEKPGVPVVSSPSITKETSSNQPEVSVVKSPSLVSPTPVSPAVSGVAVAPQVKPIDLGEKDVKSKIPAAPIKNKIKDSSIVKPAAQVQEVVPPKKSWWKKFFGGTVGVAPALPDKKNVSQNDVSDEKPKEENKPQKTMSEIKAPAPKAQSFAMPKKEASASPDKKDIQPTS